MSLLSEIRVKNDLGHPLCENLRQGNWLMECMVGRLRLEPNTTELANWLEVRRGRRRQSSAARPFYGRKVLQLSSPLGNMVVDAVCGSQTC